jgi:hypothetical protein
VRWFDSGRGHHESITLGRYWARDEGRRRFGRRRTRGWMRDRRSGTSGPGEFSRCVAAGAKLLKDQKNQNP